MGSVHCLPARRESSFVGLPSKAVCIFANLAQRKADTTRKLAEAAEIGRPYAGSILRMMLSRRLVEATGRGRSRRWAVAS